MRVACRLLNYLTHLVHDKLESTQKPNAMFDQQDAEDPCLMAKMVAQTTAGSNSANGNIQAGDLSDKKRQRPSCAGKI